MRNRQARLRTRRASLKGDCVGQGERLNSSHMYNQEKMNKALRNFDWPAVVALLPEQTLKSLGELLSSVSRSGCFIRLYSLSSEQDELRANMIDELKALSAQLGGTQGTSYVEFLLQQVEITELALAEIESSLKEDPYTAQPPDQQAWSALVWAAREMLDVHRQMQSGLGNHQEGGVVILDPLKLRVDKEHGSGLAAGRLHQLSDTVANTLRMLGHRNGWMASRKFTLPARVEPDQDNLSAAARIARLGDVWQRIVDESKYHRFWGGHFEVREPDKEQWDAQPSLEHVIVSVKTERDRRDDIRIAEYIAFNRIQRKQIVVSKDVARSNAKNRVKNPRVHAVALAPDELVSELEMATLCMLDMAMHFNPIKNTHTFGDLRILEWLRGYCVLEECYAGGLSELSDEIIQIDAKEFVATLQRAGLSHAKAETFLERVTFQTGRRDLYDAPVLRTSDGRLFFLAALYRGIDIALIISSQIGSQNLNVDSKGKAFEKAVLKTFADAGLVARTFKFSIGSTQYDCDIAVLWDEHLFIFECKNYGLPTDDPADRIFFWNRQEEAMQQVERIAKDLDEHPEVVRQHFGDDASWNKIHAVVLNASFLSFFPNSRKGTFFYDVSALGRFLKEGTLNEIHSVPVDGKRVDVSVEVKRLWKGTLPTPLDLLREMKRPSQVTMELDKYYIGRWLLPLSATSAVMFHEVASKPPDFEPLVAPDEKKAGRAKASKQRSRRNRGPMASRRRSK
jgi:hypothetical protein